MESEEDAGRRRELQRRAFAPGGALTGAEAEELRMLSVRRGEAEVAGGDPMETAAPGTDAAAPPATPPASVEEQPSPPVPVEEPATPEPEPGQETPSRRRPRWLAPVVCAAALLAGLGIAWLTSPRTSDAAPAMNPEQQRIFAAVAADDELDLDPESLRFAGEKHGAAVWTATRGDERCVILSMDDERRTGCAEPVTGSYGPRYPVTSIDVAEDGMATTVTAVLAPTLTGEWRVIVNRWQMSLDDWRSRYTDAEVALVDALMDAGFDPASLSVLGRDGELPIWMQYGDKPCIMIADPDTLEVVSACAESGASTAEVLYRDSVYVLTWSELRGSTLTIVRPAEGESVRE
ncbi:hypothetical protein ACFWHT_03490 [Microbacterium sp. NPDC058342]|uniref:hypothetical protein n=1 Tax=Microbacterium sp. NPDC058342 TaxID=3346454 RepID=UPI003650CB59